MRRWSVLGVAVAVAIAAVLVIGGQVFSGAQPWGQLLTDNLVFARSLPFTLALGVAAGIVRGLGARATAAERRGDAWRRFAPSTALMHWVTALGVLLALISGSWQYLKGVLDVESPIFMPLVYRVHYIGATLMLFALGYFLTAWALRGDRALLVPGGQWIRHLRGLAHELPGPLGGVVAALLGLDLRRTPPPTGQFTFYEKVVSFPVWTVALTLITLTGVLKAMRYVYPIPGGVLWWASALHVAAMVLIAAKLLDHLRYVLAPDRWPLLTAMVTTWMRERTVRARHGGWYEAESGRSGAQSEPGGVGRPGVGAGVGAGVVQGSPAAATATARPPARGEVAS